MLLADLIDHIPCGWMRRVGHGRFQLSPTSRGSLMIRASDRHSKRGHGVVLDRREACNTSVVMFRTWVYLARNQSTIAPAIVGSSFLSLSPHGLKAQAIHMRGGRRSHRSHGEAGARDRLKTQNRGQDSFDFIVSPSPGRQSPCLVDPPPRHPR